MHMTPDAPRPCLSDIVEKMSVADGGIVPTTPIPVKNCWDMCPNWEVAAAYIQLDPEKLAVLQASYKRGDFMTCPNRRGNH